MLLDYLERVCSIAHIWTWVIVDLVIVVVAHTIIILKAFRDWIKALFVVIYLLGMGALVYIGSPRFISANVGRACFPALAMFFFMLLSIGYSVLFAVFDLNKKPQEMFILLFPLVSLILVGNYALATGLIYSKMSILLGIGATFGPLFLCLSYLAARLSRRKEHKEHYIILFFFTFLWYAVGLAETNSDILVIFSPILLLFFMVVLGFGLAKKLDRVFG